MMGSALIVSCTEKGTSFLKEMLNAASIMQITALESVREGRRLVVERDFDLVLVNAPLRDESGENFSRDTALKGRSQVILIVKSEYFDAVSAACENEGVLTIAKPVNRDVFWATLKLAGSAQNRLRRMQAENSRLQQKIEDIQRIDRAKCLLIFHRNMSEQEAHRYIEKQAMDMRSSRRSIAERIVEAYENSA